MIYQNYYLSQYYNERKYLKGGNDVSASIPGPFENDASILVSAFGEDAASLIGPVCNV